MACVEAGRYNNKRGWPKRRREILIIGADDMFSIINAIAAWKPAKIIHHTIVFINCSGALLRLVSFRMHTKEMGELFDDCEEWFQAVPADRKKREHFLQIIQKVRLISLGLLACSTLLIIFFHAKVWIEFHVPPLPIATPINSKLVIGTFFMYGAQCFNLMSGVTIWFTLTALAMPIGELTALKEELGNIFNAIQSESADSILLPSKKNVEALDKRINKYQKRANAIFSCSIFVTYASVMQSMMSLVFVFSGKGSRPLSMAANSIVLLVALYFQCDFGSQFADAGDEVAYEALGCEWHSYPLKMQKKLLLILRVSSQRQLQLSMYTLAPLNRETYFAILQATYNLFAFVSRYGLEL